jgi:hypothetical protein
LNKNCTRVILVADAVEFWLHPVKPRHHSKKH